MPGTETSPDPAATCLHTRDQQPFRQEDNFPHNSEEDGALQHHATAAGRRPAQSCCFSFTADPRATHHPKPSDNCTAGQVMAGDLQKPPPHVSKCWACRGSQSQGRGLPGPSRLEKRSGRQHTGHPTPETPPAPEQRHSHVITSVGPSAGPAARSSYDKALVLSFLIAVVLVPSFREAPLLQSHTTSPQPLCASTTLASKEPVWSLQVTRGQSAAPAQTCTMKFPITRARTCVARPNCPKETQPERALGCCPLKLLPGEGIPCPGKE